MARRPLLLASRIGLFCALALRIRSCSAQDFCADNGGASFNSACYVFADPSVSCAEKCVAEGASCDEDALELSHPECEGALAALGVDIFSTTSSWYYNFGPTAYVGNSLTWLSSWFDENFAPVEDFRTSGCVVSPVYDATDQTSFTSTGERPRLQGNPDAAEAHNFLQEKPTCGGASSLFRRVCSCLFTAAPLTPSPTTPSPTTPAPTTAAPTTPAPSTPAPTTPAPTTPAPSTPAATTTAPATRQPTTPHPTPGQTLSHVDAGFWRTSESSADVRPCPIPDLCAGGSGGGDDLCVGSNTGPYCQVCPSSQFSSVTGVCVECGSLHGVTAVQTLGLVLAAALLVAAATFVGSVSKQAPETGKEDHTLRKGSASLVHVDETQQATIEKLWNKLLDLKLLVTGLRRDLFDKSPQPMSVEVEGLLITTEMFASKLIRLLPRVPHSEPDTNVKEVCSQADLLCPVVDQLASALAGLGAVPGEEATVVAQIKSSLETARTLDPSTSLRDAPVNDVGNAAKVVVVFAQLVAATPFVLVVRRSNTLRSFLGGLSMINVSGPKVFSLPCLFHANFHGELLFKTIGPLAVAAVIGGVHFVFRSSPVATIRPWRNRSMRCTEYFLALAYFVLTPATNAAFRTFSCETFDDGRTRLRADYSIDCGIEEHRSYRVLAIIMAVVYPIGSLATFSAVLWSHRDLLHPRQIHGRSMEDNAIAQEAKQVNASDLRQFGLLHDAYEPRAWWFESIETCRRIILGSLVVFATRPSVQLWIAMVATTLSLAVSVVFSPFVENIDGHLYSGAQAVGLALFVLALVADTDGKYGGEGTSAFVGWVMVLLVTGYILWALVALLIKFRGSRAKDGMQLTRNKSHEEGRQPSLAYLEEGHDEPEDEQATPLDVHEASVTSEQESLSFSPVVGGGDENNNNRHTVSESEDSTRDYDEGDSPSHEQTHVRGARPMGWSRRANKNTAGPQPLGSNASRRGTVAPTDGDLSEEGNRMSRAVSISAHRTEKQRSNEMEDEEE